MPILSESKLTHLIYLLRNVTEDEDVEPFLRHEDVPISHLRSNDWNSLESVCEADSLVFAPFALKLGFIKKASKTRLFERCSWISLHKNARTRLSSATFLRLNSRFYTVDDAFRVREIYSIQGKHRRLNELGQFTPENGFVRKSLSNIWQRRSNLSLVTLTDLSKDWNLAHESVVDENTGTKFTSLVLLA